MKAFEFSRAQIIAVVAAISTEVLSSEYGRHAGGPAKGEWTDDAPLGGPGFDISPAERRACLTRVARFFGMADHFSTSEPETLGATADVVDERISKELGAFIFTAAGGFGREFEHPADRIFADAAAVANLLYGRRRIVSLVAPHSLIGFSLSILAPNLLGAPAFDARGLAPEAIRAALVFGDAVVATPTLWRYLLAQGVKAPDNAMAVTFGEALTAELSAEIRKAGYGAQREIYGSTETGLVGWRDTPSDPFALFEAWRRDADALVRTAPSGATVRFTPMDFLQWENDRRFRLGGRRDGAIQIGGVNVFPAEVAARICEHPQVADCTIELSRHPGGIDRLIATITLSAPAITESLARSIDAWCRVKLRPHERPRVYNFFAG